jgi:NAD-dependent deacetylase
VPEFTLATQKVDGLHQRAGSQRVLELHGNITRTKCFAGQHAVTTWAETGELPPLCPRCGSPLRPDVVWFGEALPWDVLEAAERAATACEVFLAVGTSGVVHPAAGLIDAALAVGACVVEINPGRTPYSGRVLFALAGPAGIILPRLVQAAWPA